MLDLKAKLLQAGLVTEQQVEKAEAEQEAEKAKRKARREARARQGRGKSKGGRRAGAQDGKGKKQPPRQSLQSESERWQKRVQKLSEAGKAEQYETIRKWVEKSRLDAVKGLPSEKADRFHFDKGDGAIGWLTLEPELIEKLKVGEAGIIAFMGYNGYAWCVVPRDLALDVHVVRPDWLRALANHAFEALPLAATGKKAKKKEGMVTGEENAEQAITDEEAPIEEDASNQSVQPGASGEGHVEMASDDVTAAGADAAGEAVAGTAELKGPPSDVTDGETTPTSTAVADDETPLP